MEIWLDVGENPLWQYGTRGFTLQANVEIDKSGIVFNVSGKTLEEIFQEILSFIDKNEDIKKKLFGDKVGAYIYRISY